MHCTYNNLLYEHYCFTGKYTAHNNHTSINSRTWVTYLPYPHYLCPYDKRKIVCWLEVVNSISLYFCNILLPLLVQKILGLPLANKRPIFPPLGNILYLFFPPQKGLNLWQKREIGTGHWTKITQFHKCLLTWGGRPGF